MLRILHDTKIDFIKYWKTAAIGTVAFIALGLVLLVVHAARHNGKALNESVEFTRRHGGADRVRAGRAP